MPACFQLYPKGSDQPAKFQEIDAELCHVFNTDCHPDYYLCGWYNYIGFSLAIGKTFEEIRQTIDEGILSNNTSTKEHAWWCDIRDILDYLDANYTSNAWTEIGKR
jgi:hypothetical protein